MRNNERKQRWKQHAGVLILLALFAAEILFVTRGGHLYGYDYDWNAQHVEFPNYMRNLFYSTGKLFPDFAANLGGGQNIYYIAYYGLFSPVVLLSYLLPFIPMLSYMTGAAIILTCASILLAWRWFHIHFSNRIAFFASLMFTLAMPVMYHSHHHLMFVNYLPFMILAMEGVEQYVRNGRRLQLMLSVLLIILSSFFFSVGAILCLAVYWLYLHLEQSKATFRSLHFWNRLIRFAGTLFIPVLMSAILWLPVLHVILAGRSDTTTTRSMKEMLLPGFQSSAFFYLAYGLGLGAVFFLCVCGCLVTKNRARRFCGILFLLLLFFGLPTYVLNGGMYTDGKALIPFLPFAVFLTATFLEDVLHRRFSLLPFIIVSAIAGTAAVLTWQGRPKVLPLFLADLLFSMTVILFLYLKEDLPAGTRSAISVPVRLLHSGQTALLVLLLPALVLCFLGNEKDTLLKAEKNPRAVYGTDAGRLVKSAIRKGDGTGGLTRTDLFYEASTTANYVLDRKQMRSSIYSSLNNHWYHDYYYKKSGNEISGHSNAVIKPVKNPMNALRMGVRYTIAPNNDAQYFGGKNASSFGWHKAASSGKLTMYENSYALPIGYTLSDGPFQPDITSLSARAITSQLSALDGVTQQGSVLSFHRKSPANTTIPIAPTKTARIVQITMEVNNSHYKTTRFTGKRRGEVQIEVNGIKNILSSPNWKYANGNHLFHFTMAVPANTHRLSFRASKGNYTVSHLAVKAFSFSQYRTWRRTVFPWHAKQQSDNILSGTITAKKAGTMEITIPYDDGFSVSVDGKSASVNKSADGFLSVPITSGMHHVTLTFHAPRKRIAMAISVIGVLWFALCLITDGTRRRKREKMPHAHRMT